METSGCKTLNNDHYIYTYYQRLSAFRVLLLYDWLYKISVSFSHLFPRPCSHALWRNFQWTKLQWCNSFWNLVLTIVDQSNIHCNCYIKNF